jgi:glycosyltransferase involved in cell wall biosynthesis
MIQSRWVSLLRSKLDDMMNSDSVLQNIAVVIIGRNEGKRLLHCFESLLTQTQKIIYVDSGSTDDSVSAARQLGVEVVSLDMTLPFTAARARNFGFNKVLSIYPEVNYVQFVDGDCIVYQEWLSSALSFLESNDQCAVVCGRRKEIFPENSIYNTLCDIEWNTPIGEAKACGGDALMRVSALKAVDGYREDLIAGEEPELCVRLRGAGWHIWRLDADMTQHDANIMHFKQWWKRSVRAGYAFAEGASIHGAAPEFHWVAESRRAMIWATAIPAIIIVCLFISPLLAIGLFMIYPLQVLRMTFKSNMTKKNAFLYSFFLLLGKFPEQVGQLKFMWNQFRNKRGQLIEYK